MVKVISQKNNVFSGFVALMAIIVTAFAVAPAFATTTSCSETDSGYDGSCNTQSNFQVNVSEFLTITLSTPATGQWASGNTGTFLSNTVGVTVYSNNATGWTAFMNSQGNTNLVNATSTSSATIPTLASSSTVSAFPAGRWGYSLQGTASGNTYNAMSTSPISIFSQSGLNSTPANHPVYFGAKGASSTVSGTYSNTVVFSVVSGITTAPSTTPTNPSTPEDPLDAGTNPSYNATQDRTVYNGPTSTSSGTTTTTNTVHTGDVRTTYANAAGVTTTTVGEGTPLATGLAVTAAVAASTGVIFFIAAKRRKDDDEEEDY